MQGNVNMANMAYFNFVYLLFGVSTPKETRLILVFDLNQICILYFTWPLFQHLLVRESFKKLCHAKENAHRFL